MAIGNIADLVAATLAAAGVERIWGITGDSLNGLTESLARLGSIRWMHVRHEETGAFAAGAEAQLTGKLAVCAGSCGPGNLHLINGLFDAHRSRAPVLAIAAHIPSSEIGSNYFQETHPEILFRECSHYCELIGNPEQLPRALETAMRAAILKGGVSVIVLPGDVALKAAPAGASASWFLPKAPAPSPPEADLDRVAAILNEARRVTLFCGAGCAGAHEAVLALAKALQAPIVHSLRGKEHVEWDNPFDVGMTGFVGFSSGYHAMESCDALLLLGSDFPYRAFYPDHAKIIQVDVRPENLGRRTRLELGVLGDVKATALALLPRLRQREDSAFLDAARRHYAGARSELDALAAPSSRKLIHPQYVAKLLDEMAADDAIFACDVGTPTVWAARYLKMNGRRRLLGSFNHGSMANALPQAIGAQAAFPGRQVISMSGDGGFSMLMGDFLSLTQLQLPVKVIVFNNSSLGFVAMEMKAAGFAALGPTELQNPNFAAMAQAMGVAGFRIEDSDELAAMLKQALAHEGPALIDIVTAKQELILPPKIELQQAKGFSLYMLRAIISGRGDEIVELAKTNLLR